MPTYEYVCSKCGQQFEHFQPMTAEPLSDCLDATCGGRGTMKRLIGAGAGLIFKGSGFYITDYKQSGNGRASSSSNGRATSEAKASDSKSDAGACCACTGADRCPEAS